MSVKPPRCGKCGADHWSTQPCKGVTKPVTRNAPVTSDRNETVTVGDQGQPVTLRSDEDVTARETVAAWMCRNGFATGHGDTLPDLLGELEWQIEELRTARPVAKSNAERQKAYRERQKAPDG